MASPLSSDPVPVTGEADALAGEPLAAEPFRTEAPSRLARLRGPLLTAGIVAAGTAGLRLRDPHVGGSWGYCPWKLLTGYDCPGCGTLRAVNDLTHGDVAGAASSNLLFLAVVPVVALMWLLWTRRAWTARPSRPRPGRSTTPALVAGAALLVLAFSVLRNTPWGSWLHS